MPQENYRSGETFHAHLGKLYERVIEHERRVLWGEGVVMTVYTLDPTGGYVAAGQLSDGWSCTRNTVVAGVEEWRLDMVRLNEEFTDFAEIAAVAITGHGQPQLFKVAQAEKPEMPGHAWTLSLIPTGELQ